MNLLIKGGEVLDGTGGAPRRCDILIVGERIAAIGDLSSYKANRVIQAIGSHILPGFINVSSAPDGQFSLFNDPRQANLLKQGVTTIVRGTSGKSLAPAIYPEEILSANIGWRTMKEYLKAMKDLRPGVNFASFAGYETARRSITTNIRNLGIKEINVLSMLLKQSMDEGAAGVSFGEKGLAGLDASQAEISAMIKLLTSKAKSAFVSLKAEDKLYALFADFGIKTIIGDLNESLKTGISFDRIVAALLKKMPKSEFVFAFTPYPYYQLQIADLLPPSVTTIKPYPFTSYLKKKRIFDFFTKKTRELDFQETFIFNPSRKSAKFVIGKSLAELAENREMNKEKALAHIIEICGESTIFMTRVKNVKTIEKIAAYPKSIVSDFLQVSKSSAPIYSKLSEPFIEYLRLSNSRGERIELTAKKLASPARLLNFKNRGLIKENFFADIVILKNNNPEVTMVNGKIAYESGSVAESRHGGIITI